MSDKLELNIPDLAVEVPSDCLAMIASRAGVGKTALALWVAFSNAAKGKKVVVASMELTEQQLSERYEQHAKYHGIGYKINLLFKSGFSRSTAAFELFITETLKTESPEILVIDGAFQLFDEPDKISKFLKEVAVEYNTSVFVTPNLSRSADASIAGSIEILADADFILKLEREELVEDEGRSLQRTKIRIIKDRFGKLKETSVLIDFQTSSVYETA